MAFEPNLAINQELSNEEICNLFGCSLYGGMNRSHKTNTLVLISNPIKSIYQDRMYGDIIHYTGMGQEGNQKLEGNQNKTLYEADSNGVGIHLFEVIDPRVYTYKGPMRLASKPYQEIQKDSKGNDRNVWMFPLKPSTQSNFKPIKIEKIKSIEISRERLASKLSREELQKKAIQAQKNPGSREAVCMQYQRNEYVAEEARRRANGICQLCELPAPFKNKNGKPHLEIHHLTWLANGGEDSLENTVALCPNCHRKMHILNMDEDKEFLSLKISQI